MPRLTVELGEKTNEKLGRLAKEKGLAKVDVLRMALALYDYVEEQAGAGYRLSVTDSQGQRVTDIVLP